MNISDDHEISPDWYLHYFGPDYWLLVGSSCSALEHTLCELEFLKRVFGQYGVTEVLDLCCGIGRHAVRLAGDGYKVTGVDISLWCLDQARRAASNLPDGRIELIRADVRELELNRKFDAALFMQTSFGYFSDAQDRAVLHRVREHLRPGGIVVLDVPNRDSMLKGFRTSDWGKVGETYFLLRHRFDYFRSRRNTVLTVVDQHGVRSYGHSIRMYTIAELLSILDESGFEPAEVTGDFTDSHLRFSGDSRRVQVIGIKR